MACAVKAIVSRIGLSVTPWAVARQAPVSMGFSRPEHWSGLPLLSPGESSRPRDPTRVSRMAGTFCAPGSIWWSVAGAAGGYWYSGDSGRIPAWPGQRAQVADVRGVHRAPGRAPESPAPQGCRVPGPARRFRPAPSSVDCGRKDASFPFWLVCLLAPLGALLLVGLVFLKK